MLKSQIVDVQGTFLGTAITYAEESGVFFVAAHEAARPLHGCRFESLETARAAAAQSWHANAGASRSAVLCEA